MSKMYFPIINKLEVRLPQEFINSTNKRSISVIGFHFMFMKKTGTNLREELGTYLHSDLVQKNKFEDSFICFSNITLCMPLKYEFTGPQEVLKFWFTDDDGSETIVDEEEWDYFWNIMLELEY